MLSRSQPSEKAAELAELLATGTWTRDYPITVEVAQQLGLKVSTKIASARPPGCALASTMIG